MSCGLPDYYAGLISKDDLTRDLLEKFDIQFTRNLDITSYQGTDYHQPHSPPIIFHRFES